MTGGGDARPAATGSRVAHLWRQGRTWPGVAHAAAVAFLAAHLVLLAPGGLVSFLSFDLDDIDAINFAMGVEDYDVTAHRPHPPGYPIYILLGKIGRSTVGRPFMGHYANGYYATALAFWSALAGALAAFPLYRLFRLVSGDARVAAGAMLLTLTCPLFWYTASRPLSDMPGLAAALAIQALVATAFVRQQGWRNREVTRDELTSTGRLIVLGAFLAGIAIGLRSQSFWLTLPVIGLVIADRAGRGAAGALVGSLLTFSFGVLSWFVPLMVVSGGPSYYWHALTSQAGEDIQGVDMLLTSAEPVRRLALNLYETFVLPWAVLPLGVIVLALACVGGLVMLRHNRRAVVFLAGLAAPYAVFHLAYQENVTTRYALPLVPVVALFCARGIEALLRRASAAAVVALAVTGVVLAVPAVVAASRPHVPVFRLFHEFASRNARAANRPATWPVKPGDPVVAMHRRMFTETRRAREWMGGLFPWRLLPATRGHEWLELVKYWREGGANPIYFVADPKRTDLALIDPASRRFRGRYGWPFAHAATFVGGARPNELDWWVVEGVPAWFLGEGWALTPETAGVAGVDGKGPSAGGAVGWIRRRTEGARLVIGGRNLGAAGDPAVRFDLMLDGRAIATWDVRAAPRFFLREIDLPAGSLAPDSSSGDGPFAEIRVTAVAAGGSGRRVAASVEQFDLQPAGAVMFAYDVGWHEDEFNPRTGLRWRWSSDASAIRIWSAEKAVHVRIDVESPLQTFDEAPIVTLKAGERELVRLTPRDAFSIDVPVSAEALEASGGRLTLATSQVFVPAERVGASDPRHQDRRRLGLRVLNVSVVAAR